MVGVNEPLVVEALTPEPLGPNDVRVRVDASGVCHSRPSADPRRLCRRAMSPAPAALS